MAQSCLSDNDGEDIGCEDASPVLISSADDVVAARSLFDMVAVTGKLRIPVSREAILQHVKFCSRRAHAAPEHSPEYLDCPASQDARQIVS